MGLEPTFYLGQKLRFFQAFFAGIARKISRPCDQDPLTNGALSLGWLGGKGTMAVKLDAIRSAAARVAASHGLDVEDLIPGAEYTLEASSPGLDRKLSKAEEFQRFQGSLVKIQTFEPIRNNRHWQGRLTAGGADSITLDLNAVKQNSKTRKTGVNTVEIALTNVEKAQLVPEI